MILFYLKMKSSGEVSFFLFDQKPNQILGYQIASHNTPSSRSWEGLKI